ncbi:DUF4286 family protein [Mucilaginibacter sp. RS28]|uniref:DUF4286 family protein n=1 Tax=Mucilaginibacter straminoryzae TaxID=2932774 RepID=A0A9X1X5S0_9SPHI|nr:DUF4286 family protein [Mucilaginibacter straminoryzae]MCJ8211617.1 DUF4286 family protein [Mucilaginibacter straminoryzae]
MIIYNETFVVEDDIHDEWLQWIKANHIPAVLDTQNFESYQMLKVLNSPNEGTTYCIQYFTDDFGKYEDFMLYHLNPLHIKHNEKFENKFVVFNTLMQEV